MVKGLPIGSSIGNQAEMGLPTLDSTQRMNV